MSRTVFKHVSFILCVFLLVFTKMEPAPLIHGRDIDYTEALALAKSHDCVPIEATEPVYTLYTSGTTGTPKVRQCKCFILVSVFLSRFL